MDIEYFELDDTYGWKANAVCFLASDCFHIYDSIVDRVFNIYLLNSDGCIDKFVGSLNLRVDESGGCPKVESVLYDNITADSIIKSAVSETISGLVCSSLGF